MKINRKRFFDNFRKHNGKLTQPLVDNLNFLLTKLEAGLFKLPTQMAYILATVQHETANSFHPVAEGYYIKPESKRINSLYSYYRKNNPGALRTIFPNGADGLAYYGRGYVQITHDFNYSKFGIKDTPDKALEPETAFMIIEKGFANGTFTGLKLQSYVNESITDYRNARKCINGLDKASLIAGYARQFNEGIELVADDLAMQGYNSTDI